MRYVFGNWKMNGTIAFTRDYVKALLNEVRPATVQVALFPPFTALSNMADAVNGSFVKFGSQNMYFEESGAFTGEISPAMLEEIGVDYVLLGHSERRHIFNESDELLMKKLEAAHRHNFPVVFCIGETLDERKSGVTKDVIKRQLILVKDLLRLGDLVAYEPVWAIGTGVTPTMDEIAESISWVKDYLKTDIPVLYGGSVNKGNAKDIAAINIVDGALVGGASLKVDEFAIIIKAFGENN
ncbi:triose-phosphate isomerase [Coprothermobacter platensis]|uniref:triose-phosphate isomerase n=1 Tax=Coprothermobacter platensis TaxID=108819 RepID=UPI00036ECCBA|nr:triose-phosphate isomerase [Coprothermobacter platensis]